MEYLPTDQSNAPATMFTIDSDRAIAMSTAEKACDSDISCMPAPAVLAAVPDRAAMPTSGHAPQLIETIRRCGLRQDSAAASIAEFAAP